MHCVYDLKVRYEAEMYNREQKSKVRIEERKTLLHREISSWRVHVKTSRMDEEVSELKMNINMCMAGIVLFIYCVAHLARTISVSYN